MGTAAEPSACRMVVFEKRRAQIRRVLGDLRVADDQLVPSVPLEPACTGAATTYKR